MAGIRSRKAFTLKLLTIISRGRKRRVGRRKESGSSKVGGRVQAVVTRLTTGRSCRWCRWWGRIRARAAVLAVFAIIADRRPTAISTIIAMSVGLPYATVAASKGRRGRGRRCRRRNRRRVVLAVAAVLTVGAKCANPSSGVFANAVKTGSAGVVAAARGRGRRR